jgi:hypothetical protein
MFEQKTYDYARRVTKVPAQKLRLEKTTIVACLRGQARQFRQFAALVLDPAIPSKLRRRRTA